MGNLDKDFESISREKWDTEAAPTSMNHNPLPKNLPIPHEEVAGVYAPLVSTILGRDNFQDPIQNEAASGPFILGVTGGVAVGKSSVSIILESLFQTSGRGLMVDVMSTDGFLFPNQQLQELGIMHRKGFPESYDYKSIVSFLSSVKHSPGEYRAPTYSHTIYDVTDTKKIVKDPDILILEGLNLLQDHPETLAEGNQPSIRDFIDFCIFLDADEEDIKQWYISRFWNLCKEAEGSGESFFNRYVHLSEQDAREEASQIWDLINSANLKENILPLKSRADLILFKEKSHKISKLAFKKP
ncbi:MAG: type I pantothenate kinase [Actinomycetota bacterium]|nr:type I pantothenate kinase [Actinomycetota bacterium]